MVNSIDQTLKKVKEKFPESIIVMSTLFPRKEDFTKDSINHINDYIISLAKKSNISVINNHRITKFMLADKKHVNKNGFFTFLNMLKSFLPSDENIPAGFVINSSPCSQGNSPKNQ